LKAPGAVTPKREITLDGKEWRHQALVPVTLVSELDNWQGKKRVQSRTRLRNRGLRQRTKVDRSYPRRRRT